MPKRIKPPNKETVASTNYNYLDLPKNMEECFYDLELVAFKLSDGEDKYFAEFKVLDTDTRLKPGSPISHTLDPYQKFAETYFWRDVFNIYCVTRGKEPTKELLQKLADKHDKVLQKLVDGAGVGGACTCRIRSYTGKDDDTRKTRKEWSPLSAE